MANAPHKIFDLRFAAYLLARGYSASGVEYDEARRITLVVFPETTPVQDEMTSYELGGAVPAKSVMAIHSGLIREGQKLRAKHEPKGRPA